MTRIAVRRPHALRPAELHRRLGHVAEKLTARFGAACRFEGAVLHIEHASVTGHVVVTSDEVVVEATLGRGLGLFRHRFEAELGRILDKELGG